MTSAGGIRILFLSFAALLAAPLFCARAEEPPAAAAPLNDLFVLSADELRDAAKLIDKLAVCKQRAECTELGKQLLELVVSDPAKAVLWEVWLAGKRSELKANAEALRALPKHVTLRAALVGTFTVDLEEGVDRLMREENPGVEPDEAQKLETLIELQPLADQRYEFLKDGTVRIKDVGEEGDVHTIDFDENGHFAIVLQDLENPTRGYLRGLYKNGQLALKLFTDLPEFSFPFKMKRQGDDRRHKLAVLLEPLARNLTPEAIRPRAQLPAKWAGSYEPAENESSELTITPDGTLAQVLQLGNTATKDFVRGSLLSITGDRAEFSVEIDFFALTTNAFSEHEVHHATMILELKERKMKQTFRDDRGNEYTEDWVKTK